MIRKGDNLSYSLSPTVQPLNHVSVTVGSIGSMVNITHSPLNWTQSGPNLPQVIIITVC
jgi:hypothetical protein